MNTELEAPRRFYAEKQVAELLRISVKNFNLIGSLIVVCHFIGLTDVYDMPRATFMNPFRKTVSPLQLAEFR